MSAKSTPAQRLAKDHFEEIEVLERTLANTSKLFLKINNLNFQSFDHKITRGLDYFQSLSNTEIEFYYMISRACLVAICQLLRQEEIRRENESKMKGKLNDEKPKALRTRSRKDSPLPKKAALKPEPAPKQAGRRRVAKKRSR